MKIGLGQRTGCSKRLRLGIESVNHVVGRGWDSFKFYKPMKNRRK